MINIGYPVIHAFDIHAPSFEVALSQANEVAKRWLETEDPDAKDPSKYIVTLNTAYCFPLDNYDLSWTFRFDLRK